MPTEIGHITPKAATVCTAYNCATHVFYTRHFNAFVAPSTGVLPTKHNQRILHYHDCAQRQPPILSNLIGEKAFVAMPDMTASINGESRESLSGRFGLILAMLFVRFINAHISRLIATSSRIGLVTWIRFQGMPPLLSYAHDQEIHGSLQTG